MGGDSGGTAIHGSDDLYIGEGVDAEFVGQTILNDIYDQLGSTFGIFLAEEKEVTALIVEFGHFAVIDTVRIKDDQAVFALAEDGIEAGDVGETAINDITKDISCADTG